MKNSNCQAGTGEKPYQDHCKDLGGDVSGKKAAGDASPLKKVLDGSGAKSNPQKALDASTAEMKPDFYPGTPIHHSGPQR
jgi:hypothetical protein